MHWVQPCPVHCECIETIDLSTVELRLVLHWVVSCRKPFWVWCEHQSSTCRQTKFGHTSHTILVFAFRFYSTENHNIICITFVIPASYLLLAVNPVSSQTTCENIWSKLLLLVSICWKYSCSGSTCGSFALEVCSSIALKVELHCTGKSRGRVGTVAVEVALFHW